MKDTLSNIKTYACRFGNSFVDALYDIIVLFCSFALLLLQLLAAPLKFVAFQHIDEIEPAEDWDSEESLEEMFGDEQLDM